MAGTTIKADILVGLNVHNNWAEPRAD
jgi:hypothetical protein